MSDKKTRDRIKEFHAMAVQWAARANRAADDGQMRDAQQHMTRARDCAFAAEKLEQTLNNA